MLEDTGSFHRYPCSSVQNFLKYKKAGRSSLGTLCDILRIFNSFSLGLFTGFPAGLLCSGSAPCNPFSIAWKPQLVVSIQQILLEDLQTAGHSDSSA